MSKKLFRQIVSLAIVLATITFFTFYFIRHPQTIVLLRNTPLPTVLLLFVLYATFIGTLVWIQRATLQLCEIQLQAKENILLMMYSAIVNFFGPLQSGPGFRAGYLKSRHNVNLKKYTLATLVYYGFYATFSGLLLLSFIVGWWMAGAILAIIAGAPLMFKLRRFQGLDMPAIRTLGLATLSQSLVQSIIYFVELRTLLHHVSYSQALVYTGAANSALFVSITPGAIGFRESFLLLASRLHHIGASTIATASLLDRSVYVSLLAVMAVYIFGFHANKYLHSKEVSSGSSVPES